MGEKKVKGILIAAFIWIIIIGGLAVATKYLILPYFQEALEDETGSESQYKHEIILAADSFSGYCILRSPVMTNDLKSQGIRVTIRDDNADYQERMGALDNGDISMSVFTVDSFVLTGSRLGRFPATIVMVIDETKGADAIVSYKGSVKSIQDLNSPEARIVLTPASPSEFLARTVIAHFNLPNLPEEWQLEADGAADVYRKFIAADENEKRAYVLWEPYVSKALEKKGTHLLLDSSKLKGYIVDVLVAERRFLRDHPDLVKAVVEAYLRAAYSYNQSTDGMQTLVVEDSKETGAEALTKAQAKKLVQGIEWKNTLENYAYFGLLPSDQMQHMQHIEDVIANIINVLRKTGAIPRDPLEDKVHTIFYDNIMKQLQASDFHPGKKVSIIEDFGLSTEDLETRPDGGPLRSLNKDEWKSLVPVGTMRVKPISFARGTARINIQSRREMDRLAHNLAAWPKYYLMVVGHARAEGDPKANLRLARDRADTGANYLIKAGVDKNRIRVKAASPSKRNGSAQSVSFELLQMPY